MTVAFLRLQGLSDDENALVSALSEKLAGVAASNRTKAAYYEGEQLVRMMGISVPPELRSLQTVVGWAGTAVDVLEERLDWEGWSDTGDSLGLDSVFSANRLNVESCLAHLDALVYGTGFVTVGSGEDGPLVTVESAANSTGMWDVRTRRLSAALVQRKDPESGQAVAAALYTPMETVWVEWDGARWAVHDRDRHNLGRVPVARLVNRPRSGSMEGRSEISKAVRGYTDAAVRTLLGMEVNREFFSAPQRWAINVSRDQFEDRDGNMATGWQTIMGRLWAMPPNEDEQEPKLGQFPQSTPGPYLDQVRGLAQLLSAETAIPATYLGFATDQAASADAIRAMESRLEKRARRRQSTFGMAWHEVARLALLIRDGEVPPGFDESVGEKWTDPATPTPSAAADVGMKLVAAGILTPDSEVTYDRVGLSAQERRQVEADKRKANLTSLTQRLADSRVSPDVQARADRRVEPDDQ